MADLTSLLEATGVEVTAALLGPGIRWSNRGGAFRAASVTKTFVAATALILAEQAVVSLDEPVVLDEPLAALLRDWPPMSLRDLLGHRSGLPDHSSLAAYQELVLADPARRWRPEEQLAVALSADPPTESPHYSDTGYVLVGSALSRATGRPLGELVESVLDLERHAPATRWETVLPVDRFPQRVDEIDVWSIDASVDLFGGGGLVTTAEDLASFGRALLAGEVVSEASLQQMKDEGLGLMRAPGQREVWGHTGFWGTAMLVDATTGTAVGLATGQAPISGGPDPGALALRVLETVL